MVVVEVVVVVVVVVVVAVVLWYMKLQSRWIGSLWQRANNGCRGGGMRW